MSRTDTVVGLVELLGVILRNAAGVDLLVVGYAVVVEVVAVVILRLDVGLVELLEVILMVWTCLS